MDFSWSDEQREMFQAVSSFARKELNEKLIEHDRDAFFNRAGWNNLLRQAQAAADVIDDVAICLMENESVNFLSLPTGLLKHALDGRQLDLQ